MTTLTNNELASQLAKTLLYNIPDTHDPKFSTFMTELTLALVKYKHSGWIGTPADITDNGWQIEIRELPAMKKPERFANPSTFANPKHPY